MLTTMVGYAARVTNSTSAVDLGFSAEETAELLRHADTNGDGLLNYREFVAEFGLVEMTSLLAPSDY